MRLRRVQVRFGEHVIIDNVLEEGKADWYAHSIGRRFAGLPVTNEPVPPDEVALELARQ
ncbi:hypothetical protein GCM10029976_090620 [Kribbella albertanoniae]|uniref:hypothetical protein n=1 Tax=Kribbella albertanoniae TaxID=1266829 RepID=UPI001404ACD7|nr:hypothetical protein [Kribbella albertanoniae]